MALEVQPWHIVAFTIAGLAFVMGVVLLVVYCCWNPRRKPRRGSPPPSGLLATDHVVNTMATTPAMLQEGKEKVNPLFSRHSSFISSDSNSSIGILGDRRASNGSAAAAGTTTPTLTTDSPSADRSSPYQQLQQHQEHQQPELLPVAEEDTSSSSNATASTQATGAQQRASISCAAPAIVATAELEETKGFGDLVQETPSVSSAAKGARPVQQRVGESTSSFREQPQHTQAPDRPQSQPVRVVLPTQDPGNNKEQQLQQSRQSQGEGGGEGKSGDPSTKEESSAEATRESRAAKLRAMREARARRKKDEWAMLEESLAIIDRLYKDVCVSNV